MGNEACVLDDTREPGLGCRIEVCVFRVVAKLSRSGEGWNKMEALRAVLMGVLVQAAANVNNTYWDFINGVDTPTVRSCFNLWCCT